MRGMIAVFSLAALSGCASITEGSSQSITVITNPPGAICELYRDGTRIGEVQSTPGSALIEKTRHDLIVTCGKVGYQSATFLNHSGVESATAGNILIGGIIGLGIDSATGALNKYDSAVNLSLVPEPAPPPPIVAPVAIQPASPRTRPNS